MEETRYIFTLRVVYKNGYVYEFDVYSFEYENGSFTWTPANLQNKPIILGADDVMAVFQVGMRTEEVN
jgi:hypothetical protein